MRKDYPDCPGNKTDCFANYQGVCRVLSNTKFKRSCPFYKTAEAAERECQRHYIKHHLAPISMKDLLGGD